MTSCCQSIHQSRLLDLQGMMDIFEISFAKSWTVSQASRLLSASNPKRFATMRHPRRHECHLLDGHLRSVKRSWRPWQKAAGSESSRFQLQPTTSKRARSLSYCQSISITPGSQGTSAPWSDPVNLCTPDWGMGSQYRLHQFQSITCGKRGFVPSDGKNAFKALDNQPATEEEIQIHFWTWPMSKSARHHTSRSWNRLRA